MELATLTLLEPRKVWPHEELDFTPWLLENLDLLSEAIGIELDKDEREREVFVGRYTADIVAKEVGGNRRVIIENQLTNSDHGHLGQLLTYAAGLEANIVIWVCRELRDEHRRVLDWLNLQADTRASFIGVELEVLKIDKSLPAVRFNPVVLPQGWQDSTYYNAPEGRNKLYQDFFQNLMDELREKHNYTSARKALPQPWYSFSTGVQLINYNATFTGQKTFRVEVNIATKEANFNKAVFDLLQLQKGEIEQKLSAPLLWNRAEGWIYSRIYYECSGSIEDSEEKLQQLRAWAIKNLLKFKAVFSAPISQAAKEIRNQIEN